MKHDELNPRERRFVSEYLVDMVGSRAAVRAGYAPSGAKVQAMRLLRRPAVRAAVDERMAEARGQTTVTVQSVLEGFLEIANDSETTKKDRLHALDSLARYLGMFIERRQVTTDSPKVSLDLSDDKVREKALDFMAELRKKIKE